ncbi:glycosyltransferase family 2 protein [Paenibacillus sp. J2TS4]|uniref:glycosyltransferase n=1 Tax=Paenibacillus sp. J2TS4 TaxID=2807194 RepID=UPI001B19C05E|nr:glycosyltransferase family A protein [Paenibacillus sp. J2TS4]GIP31290.1 glycosyl transferase [Paenibacillus sp. J2TS4]
MSKQKSSESKNNEGISIITCTKRQEYLDNVFDNYRKQTWKLKELIIILNKDDMDIEKFRRKARKYENVTVYQLPEGHSLGECLNFGVDNSKHSYVAKFDDDDYYSPHYLTECMYSFKKTNADIVGKYTHYVYLEGSNLLLLRSPKNENKFVSNLPGATMVIKKEVFDKVRFPDRNLGEDSKFCGDCGKLGFKMFSNDRYNFVAVRRENAKDHTWPISDQKLVSSSNVLIIPYLKDFREYVTKSSDIIDN